MDMNVKQKFLTLWKKYFSILRDDSQSPTLDHQI